MPKSDRWWRLPEFENALVHEFMETSPGVGQFCLGFVVGCAVSEHMVPDKKLLRAASQCSGIVTAAVVFDRWKLGFSVKPAALKRDEGAGDA